MVGVAVVVVGLAAFIVFRVVRAGGQAEAARNSFRSAQRALVDGDAEKTRAELVDAKKALRRMKAEMNGLGPVLPVARVVPVMRSQVRAVDKMEAAGMLLSDAGLRLANATERFQETESGQPKLSQALSNLEGMTAALDDGAASVRAALAEVDDLEDTWLIGPVGGARDELLGRLRDYERQTTSAADGARALIVFAGGEGPRRYLFLSQNPDEIRPTGGFIGTYGLLSTGSGDFTLERFEPIQRFREIHPDAVVPGGETTSPFRFARPPRTQDLGNVNNVADFPAAAQLARQLWNGAGEPPVDGVVSATPAFLARLLGVLGAVKVPEYGETIDEHNLIERFDHYTALLELDPGAHVTRKAFVAALAEQVMAKLLDAPSRRWRGIAKALGEGFDAREAMAWSTDQQVAAALAARGWDGTLPRTTGDFFYNAEFSYLAKFNRGLQREFDHHVQLRPDGSALITTTITINNTRDRGKLNPGSLSYITIYGPEGATIDLSSDPPVDREPPLAGHPGAGWLINAQPHSSATFKVVWNAKDIAYRADGRWQYSLRWLRVPDHTGDVLNLRVDLGESWEWEDEGPPSRIELDDDVEGSWALSRNT